MVLIVMETERLSSMVRSAQLACFFALIFLLQCPALGQLSSAFVNGIVRDPSGAVIPNATVVLRNVQTEVEFTATSNGSGLYTFLNIVPGQYALKAMATGFSTVEVPSFTLTVSQIATIDFHLQLGTVTSQVLVDAATSQLETSSSTLGSVTTSQQANDLPLNGRNFTQLLELSPGISTANQGQNTGGGGLSPYAAGSSYLIPVVNGQTGRSNSFLVDGFDDNELQFDSYAVPPIVDDIAEFKIVSHADSAQFGSVLGGIVNVVTKSGTNDLHGALWDYYRDQIFDAQSYFLPSTVPKTPFHQSQFGASTGGPVIVPKLYDGKDKTFFFGAYQGFRYSQGGHFLITVPTAAELAGDESSWPSQIYNPYSTRPNPANPGTFIRDPFPGNQIPSNLIDPRVIAYAKFLFPAAGPTLDASGDNAIDPTPTIQTQNEFNIRVDQKIGKNDSAFFRYSFIDSTETFPSGLPVITSAVSTPDRTWGVNYVHVFNPRLVLQAQVGGTMSRSLNTSFATSSTSGVIAQAGFASAFVGDFTALSAKSQLLPSPGITGYASAGEYEDNILKDSATYQGGGTLTRTLAKHLLTFGGNYNQLNYTEIYVTPSLSFSGQQTADTNPNDPPVPGSPLASFLLNVPTFAHRVNFPFVFHPGAGTSYFGQDAWKVTDRLTVNAGLRYDITYPFTPDAAKGAYGGDMDLTNGTYRLPTGLVPGYCSVVGHAPCIPGSSLPANVVVGKWQNPDYEDFGPRIGVAFRANTKTALRGGFGIFYDSYVGQEQGGASAIGAWPNVAVLTAANLNVPTLSSPTPTVQLQSPLPTSPLPPATPFSANRLFFDPYLKIPRSMQWNVGVERTLNSSTTLAAIYVGARGSRLYYGGYYNTALTPGPGDVESRALWNYITTTRYVRSVGSESYNALQVLLDKRMSNGLLYQLHYTLSKNIDNGDDDWLAGIDCQSAYNLNAYGCRGPAGLDEKHFLSFNAVDDLPFGTGQRFSTGNRAADYLLGHWQANAIFVAHSGIPYYPWISSDIANTGDANGYESANLVGDPNNVHKNPAHWFNTAAYAVPSLYTFGTTPRNSLRGPAFWNLDGSLFRQFPIRDSRQVEFRAEAFNLMNHADLGLPITDLNAGTEFGTIKSTANNSRQVQLAIKIIY
jgi:hypothetical protein